VIDTLSVAKNWTFIDLAPLGIPRGGAFPQNYKYMGGVLAPNNNIYLAPAVQNNILKIKTGVPQISQWMLQPYYNKF
jgi:hypothetical protein